MCVIFIAQDTRPTENMVKAGWDANPAGGGVAWREEGFVHWRKGLELVDMLELAETLPMPYVMHFRIPSVGGKRADLCHPFPIQDGIPLALEGRTQDYVLFHNGHWTPWRTSMLEAAIHSNTKVPVGKWSDTRSMAFHAHIYGLGVLEIIDEKAVAFGPTHVEVFPGTGWRYHQKVWCSNMFWDKITTNHQWNGRQQVLCKDTKCQAHRYGESEYCYQHQYMVKPDDLEELPVLDVRPVENPDKTKDETTALVKVHTELPTTVGAGITAAILADMEVRAAEVRPNETPFELATRLHNSTPPRLSKNKWKKYRRAYEQELRDRNPGKTLKFHEMTEPPVIVH